MGFAVGLASGGGEDLISISEEDAVEEIPAEGPQKAPAPRTVPIPEEDVPGADLEGLQRYPGSVRIEYLRERQGDVIWTEIEYLADAPISEAREFYRDSFRTADWHVNDIGFAQNSWVFFVVKEDREVFVELKPRGSGVEIDLEQTEPVPVKPKPDPTPMPSGEDYDDDFGDYDD